MAEKKRLGSVDKLLTAILLIALIACIIALIYIIIMPKHGERFTEFYILGPSGKAEGYPRVLRAGERASVIIGIVNHEYRTVNYTVEVWLVNETVRGNKTKINHLYFMKAFRVTLNSTGFSPEGEWKPQWEKMYNFSINRKGKFKLWFLLFKYRINHLPEKFKDYAGTPVEKKFLNATEGKGGILSLNLNIVVK